MAASVVYGSPDGAYEVVSQNADDIMIAIKAHGETVFFPCDSYSATKTIDTKMKYGTGSHQVRAKNHGHIAYTLKFTVGTWLRKMAGSGESPAGGRDLRKFHELLFDDSDEGLPREFELYMLDDAKDTSEESTMVIEKFTGCSVTSDAVDVPDGDTVTKTYDAVAARREPL